MPKLNGKALDVQHAFWSNHAEIEAVWLFGSAQTGFGHAGSDVDLGIWFKAKPSLDTWAELRASIQEETGIDDIDLITLNDAPAILQFEAVRGRLLYCRNAERCAGFVSLVAREYEDEVTMLEKYVRLCT
jgi:uncharacterized protein